MKAHFTRIQASQTEGLKKRGNDEVSHQKLWGFSSMLLTILLLSVIKLAKSIGRFQVTIDGENARSRKVNLVNTGKNIWEDITSSNNTIETTALASKYKTGFSEGLYFEHFHKEALETHKQEYLKTIQKDIEQLMKEAKVQLYNATCLPAVCNSPVGFFSERVPKVMLASRPGSGNTWVRTLIRSGMRVYTGSVFNDWGLARGGFKGERVPYNSEKIGVMKSHFPALLKGGISGIRDLHGAIHLIRAPLDAVVADCNRFLSKGNHTGSVPPEVMAKKCSRIARREHTGFFHFWEAENDSGQSLANFSGTVRVKLVRKLLTFTIFYEDLVNHLEHSLLYLFSVLKYFYRNKIPDVHESIMCALRDVEAAEQFHRKKAGTKGYPYLGFLCDTFRNYWNVNKW
eukprot:CAMPEP_0203761184 /NCGR_PEP_ID=MMETSP0098-20131031/14329_1 /ASSEMBLY_ACC=CAM_ASM_000208 /TAXON_ID=96639 /ORGANISM=" , Strain NY0313808BC1" /LENGTH=399 /DNA_ID=CAMNT_0050655071 /DNA_START=227 /DNA_END=1423 /DNA_ORIENTATION=+